MHCLFRGRVVPEKYYTLASKLQPWREESDLAFLTHPLKFLMRHPPEIFQLRSLRTVLSFVGQGTSPNDAHGSGPREGLVGDRGLRRDVLILGDQSKRSASPQREVPPASPNDAHGRPRCVSGREG